MRRRAAGVGAIKNKNIAQVLKIEMCIIQKCIWCQTGCYSDIYN